MKLVKFFPVAVAVILLVALLACGSEDQDSETTSGAGSSDTSATATEGKLSANNASDEDLKAAFEAAGIPNAEQWAHEVEEYRPYPEDDPDFTKLRGDLAKYNPGPGVVDQIVELLTLP